MSDLGVGSRDAVVLSGELAELLGRPVSPVDFWQYPTINALIAFLTAPESESAAEAILTRRARFRSTSRSPSSDWVAAFRANIRPRSVVAVPV